MDIDLLLSGGHVVTLDDSTPTAEAIAVHQGRILAIGTTSDLAGLRPRRHVDLAGVTVVPGFGDAHNHMAWFGLSLDEIDLLGQTDLEQVYAAVAARARTLPADGLVVGSGYDDNVLGGHPDRARLDEAAAGRRVWLKHRSGHVCVVNTPMLGQIGVLDGSAAVPQGGVVVHEGGAPTGVLQEQAQNLAVSVVTPYSLADLGDALARASAVYAAEGLTHVTECGIGAGWLGKSPVELAAYQRCRDAGRLAVRARLMPCVSALHDLEAHDDDGVAYGLDLGVATGFGDDQVRVGAMKIWLDGSLLARTAAMTEDYACRCHPDHPAGYLQDDPETMRRQILAAAAGGWDIAAHAIGDAAVEFALDVIEEATDRARRSAYAAREPRHRIEHAGVTTDAQIARMARLGVTPVPQMRFLHAFGDTMATALGPERRRLLYRHKSFLDNGIRVPGSSDRPVADGAPLKAMATMQDRLSSSGTLLGAHERVDARTALAAYTVDAAWVARDEDRRGTLTPGKLADLVLLDTDVSTAAPEAVEGTTVLATVIDGLATHDLGLGLPARSDH